MALEYVQSARGNNLAVYNNFIYRSERVYKAKTTWKCVKYDVTLCPGRIHSINNTVVNEIEHSHLADPAEISSRKIVTIIRQRAEQTLDQPQNIVANACGNLTAAVIGKLPSIAGLKRTIRRKRQRTNAIPANPLSLSVLVIPDQYKIYNNINFLLHDSGEGDDRLLVFSTPSNLQFMSAHPNWFCDGTFSACPLLFNQIYTIHVAANQFSVPVIFALLPNRTQNTYERLFNVIKNLKPDLTPETIMTDFEQASINAMIKAFPLARQCGCFFHFRQCIFRRIQQTPNLLQTYESDPDAALQINCLGALVFVPPEDVVAAYEELVDSQFYVENAETLQHLLDYMEDTWIGRLMRGTRRRKPLYALTLWNQYRNVIENHHKTNNFVESWNNSFNNLLGAAHPTIWKVIDGFKQQQALTDVRLEQRIRGDVIQRKKKFKTLARRLKAVVDEYDSGDKLTYLRGISHNIFSS